MASLSRKIKRTQLKKERAKNRHATPSMGRSALRAQLLGAGIGGALVLLSLPSTAVAGQGFTETVSGNTTTFHQTADKVFNKVDQYNIGVDQIHKYIQPSASAIFVQRVMGQDPSSILGQLTANGQVWIMNPSGVMIGSQARINTAGFMATSMVMGEDDFFAGRYKLESDGTDGYVVNHGDITVNNGGYAILAGGSVVNDGHISALDGDVVLAAGRSVSFDMNGDGLINFEVNAATAASIVGPDGTDLTSAVLNSGQINAQRVAMTAQAKEAIFNAVVNNTGVVEATSVETGEGGVIKLTGGDQGDVLNSGTLDASGTTGGDVQMSGERVGQLGTVHADGLTGNGGTVGITADNAIALGPDSLTTADAGLTGDGGTVSAITDGDALFRTGAAISARGGSQAGDGGFVEVSGHQYVEINGTVDTTAANGLTGNFLIDPTDMTISHSDVAGGNVNIITSGTTTFSSNSNTATLTDYTINTQLATTNVTVTSAGGGAGAGNITFNNGVDIEDTANSNSLTFTAVNTGSLALNNAIINMNGDLTLTAADAITAGSGSVTAGSITMGAGSSISTSATLIQTSSFTATAATGITMNNLNVDTGGGTIDVTNTGAGDVDIVNTGDVSSLTASVANGSFTLANGGNVVISSVGASTAASISVTNIDDTINGGMIDSPDVTLNALSGAGIGNSSAISLTDATSVTAETLGGDIDLTNNATSGAVTADFSIATVLSGDITYAQTGTQNLTVSSASSQGGDVTLSNDGGTISVTNLTTYGGAVNADTSNADITIHSTTSAINVGQINAGSGNVVLNSQLAIVADSPSNSIIGATVSLTAQSGGIGTFGPPIEVDASTLLNADTTVDNANIYIEGFGTNDIPLGLITTGDPAAGNVYLSTAAGSGIGFVDGNGDTAADNIVAGTATITADTKIGEVSDIFLDSNAGGGNNALETNVGTLNLTTTAANGQISISDNGSPTILTLEDTGGSGTVLIDTAGDQNLGSVPAGFDNAGFVSGGILTIPNSTVSIGNDLRLEGNDITNIGGTLSLNATSLLIVSNSGENIVIPTGGATLTTLDVETGGNTTITDDQTGTGGLMLTDLNTSGDAVNANGDFELDANDGITAVADVTATGNLTLNADNDQNGGMLTVNTGVAVTANYMEIDASDLDINGTGSISVPNELYVDFSDSANPSADIGLGQASGYEMNISNAELGNITTYDFYLVNGTSAPVTIDDVTAANTDFHAFYVDQNSGAQISFENNPSSFGADFYANNYFGAPGSHTPGNIVIHQNLSAPGHKIWLQGMDVTGTGGNNISTNGAAAAGGQDGNSAGEIWILADSDVNLAGNITARGSADNGATYGGWGGFISIHADGNITVGTVNSSGATGSTDGGNAGSIDIAAGLNGVGSFTSTGAITADGGNGGTTGGEAGNIGITTNGAIGTADMTIGGSLSAQGGTGSVPANDGSNADITLNSAGALTINDGYDITGNHVSITAAGDFTAVNAGAYITATADDDTALQITAAKIGTSAVPIHITVDNDPLVQPNSLVTLTSTGTGAANAGDIHVASNAGINLGTITVADTTDTQDVQVTTTSGDINIDGATNLGANVNALLETSTVNGGDININNYFTAGTIDFTARGNLVSHNWLTALDSGDDAMNLEGYGIGSNGSPMYVSLPYGGELTLTSTANSGVAHDGDIWIESNYGLLLGEISVAENTADTDVNITTINPGTNISFDTDANGTPDTSIESANVYLTLDSAGNITIPDISGDSGIDLQFGSFDLYAGGDITISGQVKTANLSAQNATTGDFYIHDANSVTIDSGASIATGVATNNGGAGNAASGNILIYNVSNDLTINGDLSTGLARNTAGNSGNTTAGYIDISSVIGSVTINGALSTGNATINSANTGSAMSSGIAIGVYGPIGGSVTGDGSLTTGTATSWGGDATTGTITVEHVGGDVSGITGTLDFTTGQARARNNAGTGNATSGSILLDDIGGNVTLATFTVHNAIVDPDTAPGNTATSGDIVLGDPGGTGIAGGIGSSTDPVLVTLGSATATTGEGDTEAPGDLQAKTNYAGSAGDIYIALPNDNFNANNTNFVYVPANIVTAANDTQLISFTVNAGPFQLGGPVDVYSQDPYDAIQLISAAQDIDLNGQTITAGGGITLNAFRDIRNTGGAGILLDADSPAFGVNAGDIILTAGRNINIPDVAMTAQGNFAAGGMVNIDTVGNGTYTAGNISIGAITTAGFDAGGDVDIQSATPTATITLNGDIDTTGFGDGGYVTLHNPTLLSNAGAGITISTTSSLGVGGKVEFMDTLDADHGGGNREYLVVDAGTGDVDFDGAVGFNQALESLTVSSSGTTNFYSTVDTIDYIDVTASDLVNIYGNITTQGGDIDLSGDNGVLFVPPSPITPITVNSNDGNVALTASAGPITMRNGDVINSGAGTITLSAQDDISLGQLISTFGPGVAVDITSTAGAVLNINDPDTNNNVTAVNGELDVSGYNGVGQLDNHNIIIEGNWIPLQTNVAALKVDTTADQTDIAINNVDAGSGLEVVNVTPASNGTGYSLIETTGDMTIDDITSTPAQNDHIGFVSSGTDAVIDYLAFNTVVGDPINVGTGTIRFESIQGANANVLQNGGNILGWTAENLVFKSSGGGSPVIIGGAAPTPPTPPTPSLNAMHVTNVDIEINNQNLTYTSDVPTTAVDLDTDTYAIKTGTGNIRFVVLGDPADNPFEIANYVTGNNIFLQTGYGTITQDAGADITATGHIQVAADGGATHDAIFNADVTASTYIDVRAADDIIINGTSTFTTDTASIYLRANNDGILNNDGGSGLEDGGNVVLTGSGAGSALTFDVKGTGTDGVVWVAGENIYAIDNVKVLIKGGQQSDTIPSQDFGMALLASTNVGSVADPIYITGTVEGSFITIGDQDLSNMDPTFSHSVANPGGRLVFTADALGPDGNGFVYVSPDTNVVSHGDIVIIAPNTINIDKAGLFADDNIFVNSTAGDIIVPEDTSLKAGLDQLGLTGNITLDAFNNVTIEDNVTLAAGAENGKGTILITAENGNIDVGMDGSMTSIGGSISMDSPNGYITVGDNTGLTADHNINMTSFGPIYIGGTVKPLSGSFDALTGENGGQGGFTLGSDGNLILNSALTIGPHSGANSNVEILNPTSDPVVTLDGNINTNGTITVDLTGLGNLEFSGNMDSGGNVYIITDGANSITGYGNIVGANRVGITTDTGEIQIGNINANNWIYLDSTSGNITTGALTASANATSGANSGYAVKITTTGNATVGATTALSLGSLLNVSIDPTDVTLYGPVNITGNYDATATNDITVNANINTSGGNITLTADNDINVNADITTSANSGQITLSADDDAAGGGDLTMAPDAQIQAVHGTVTLSGDNSTLYDVIAGNGALSVTGTESGTIGVNGLLKGNDVTLAAGNGDVDINADPHNTLGAFSITTAAGGVNLNADLKSAGSVTITPNVTLGGDSTVSAALVGAAGTVTFAGDINSDGVTPAQLTISNGNGDVVFHSIGNTDPIGGLAVTTTGTTTFNGDVATQYNIDLSQAKDVVLGANRMFTSSSGNIDLDGATIDGNGHTLDLFAPGGNIYLGTIGNSVDGLTADGLTTYLDGNITVNGPVSIGPAVLETNVAIDTHSAGAGADIELDGATGNYDLTLNAGDEIGITGAVNTADVTMTAPNGIYLGASVTGNNNVTMNSPVYVGSPTVDTVTVQATNGSVDFAGTIDSIPDNPPHTLIVKAGDTATFDGMIGGFAMLDGFTVNADQINLNADVGVVDGMPGAYSLTFTGPTNLSGDVAVDDIATFNSPVTLTNGDWTVEAYNGVDFADTIDSDINQIPWSLNVYTDAENSYATFDGKIGGVAGLYDLDVSAYEINLNADIGSAAFPGADTVTLNSFITNLNGNVNVYDDAWFLGDVVLGADDTVVSWGTVEFDGYIDSDGAARNLAINAADSVTFGDTIGEIGVLGAFTVTANQINLDTDVGANGNAGAASLTFNGPTALGGNVDVTNDAAFNGAVTLTNGNWEVDAGTAHFTDTIDSDGTARDLTVNADNAATFDGIIGGNSILDAFEVTADQINLNADVGDLGDGAASLTFIGPTKLGGDVSVTNAAMFDGAVILTGNRSVTAGSADFTGTIDSDGTARNLTVNADNAATFGGVIGDASALGAFAVTAGQINLNASVGDADDAGATSLMFSGPTNLGGNVIVADAAEFDGAVTLIGNRTVTATTADFTSTIDSDGTARNLTVNADDSATFGGVIGGISPLNALTVTAGQINLGGDVNVTNAAMFDGAVILTGDRVVNAGSADFTGTIDSDGTARDLTVNADNAATFGGLIGGTSALDAFVVDAGQINLDANVGNGGDGAASLTFSGPTNLGGNVNVTNAVTFNNAVTLIDNRTVNGGSVDFGGTIDSDETAGSLTVNADNAATFGGVIGGMSPLNALTVTAGQINLNNNVGNGGAGAASLTFTGPTNLGGNVDVTNAAMFNSPVTLTGNRTVTAGTATFASTIDSDAVTPRNLTVNADTATFDGVIGGNRVLGAFAVTADQINLNNNVGSGGAGAAYLTFTGPTNLEGNVNVTNAAMFDGAVTLIGDRTVTAGTATFGSTVDSDTTAGDLTVNATTTTFHGNVGQTHALDALTVNGAAVLSSDVAMTTGTADFNGTLDSDTVTARSLTMNATTTTFDGNVGGVRALKALTVNGATILGGNITANNAATFDGAVTLTGNRTVNAGTADFMGTVDSDAVTARSLTVNADTATFDEVIGGIRPLNTLTVTAEQINLNDDVGNPPATAGVNTLTFNGPTVLGADVSVIANTDVNLEGDVTGPFNLMVAAGNNFNIDGLIKTGKDVAGTAGNDISISAGNGVITEGNVTLGANADLNVDGDVVTTGDSSMIKLVADADGNAVGDLIIGNNGYATIESTASQSNQIAIDLEGESVIVGNPGAPGGHGASIIALGGNIKVIGNRNGTSTSGNFVLNSDSVMQAAGTINIDDPYDDIVSGKIIKSGNIEIYALHNVEVNNLVESTGGSVIIKSDTDQGISGVDPNCPGSIYLNATVSAAKDVTLNSNTGSVVANPSGLVAAGGNGYFDGQTFGVVDCATGNLSSPIAVDIDGTLHVNAQGAFKGVSGRIDGTVGALAVGPTTPGMVFFNGVWVAHQGPLARAFAKFASESNPYVGTEVGGMEELSRSMEMYNGAMPWDTELREYRPKLDVYGDALYAPYPDLITDYRTCE